MIVGRIGDLKLEHSHDIDQRTDNLTINIKDMSYHGSRIISLSNQETVEEQISLTMSLEDGFNLEGLAKQRLPVWIDTSFDIGNRLKPVRGYYVITGIEPTLESDYYGTYLVSLIKITGNQSAPLRMKFTPAYDQGALLPLQYPDTVSSVLFNDGFSSGSVPDPTLWDTPINVGGLTLPTTTVTGGYLQFTGYSGGGGWRGTYLKTKGYWDLPLEIEFNLWRVSNAVSGYTYEGWVYLSDQPLRSGFSDIHVNSLRLGVSCGYGTTGLYLQRYTNGVSTTLWSKSVPTWSNNFKLILNSDGSAMVYLDQGPTGTFIPLWGSAPTGFNTNKDLSVAFLYATPITTPDQTLRSDYFKISRSQSRSYPNLIFTPADTTKHFTPPTGYRTGLDGAIPYHVDPDPDPGVWFKCPPQSLNSGGVKAYKISEDGTEYRRIFNRDEPLSQTDLFIHNSLLGLETAGDSVNFYHWYPVYKDWLLLNSFQWTDIDHTSLVTLNPYQVAVDIEGTYWYINRGRQFLRVQHPHDSMNYTKKDYYYHDGVETNIVGDYQDVTMDSSYYCNVYDKPGGVQDDYCLQILRLTPGTIKNDTLPESNMTGLGWYHKNETGYNGYQSMSQEFIADVKQVLDISRR